MMNETKENEMEYLTPQMESFIEDLQKLLEKHQAFIYTDEDRVFLQVHKGPKILETVKVGILVDEHLDIDDVECV